MSKSFLYLFLKVVFMIVLWDILFFIIYIMIDTSMDGIFGPFHESVWGTVTMIATGSIVGIYFFDKWGEKDES